MIQSLHYCSAYSYYVTFDPTAIYYLLGIFHDNRARFNEFVVELIDILKTGYH